MQIKIANTHINKNETRTGNEHTRKNTVKTTENLKLFGGTAQTGSNCSIKQLKRNRHGQIHRPTTRSTTVQRETKTGAKHPRTKTGGLPKRAGSNTQTKSQLERHASKP